MHGRPFALKIGLAILVCAVTGIPVFGAGTGLLTQISGTSPFGVLDDCGNFPGLFNVENFVNSEVQPRIDVNPSHTANIVAIWQQDRWSDGGSRGNVAGVSFDGGTTWQIVPIPMVADCTGGPWERASDPWVEFGPDGQVFYASLDGEVR